jgi:hypothetical protein
MSAGLAPDGAVRGGPPEANRVGTVREGLADEKPKRGQTVSRIVPRAWQTMRWL